MKKLLIFTIVFIIGLVNCLQAQICNGALVEAFPRQPQTGSHNYFGVRVTLTQPYSQNVTVTGTIHSSVDPGSYPTAIFTLIVPAGSLSAQTSDDFYQMDPTGSAEVTVESVTPCPFQLSEEESYQILLSSELQNFIQKRNEFLDRISNAVNQVMPLDSIRNAALAAIQNGNYQSFYTMVFGSNQEGESFFSAYVAARDALLQANTFVQEHPEMFTCQTCNSNLIDETNYFFDNFQSFNTYRFTPGEELIEVRIKSQAKQPVFASYSNYAQNVSFRNFERAVDYRFAVGSEKIDYNQRSAVKKIVCGSYWNQVKLSLCAAGCGVTTAGLAAGLCGWGCWCTFCTKNSALATAICAD